MIEAGSIGLRLSPIATGFWNEAKAKVKAQRSEAAEMKVTANIGRASSEIAAFRIREQANAINLKVKIDESSLRTANEKVKYIEHTWSQSPLKKAIRINVMVAGAVALPALTQGIMSLTAAMTELSRASLVLPGLFSGLAATFATVTTGIGGMGAALKASNDGMQKSAQYARQYATASRELETAQRGVVKALRDANREIQDQKDKLAQGQLSVEQAQLNVLRANQELYTSGFKGFIEYKQALLGVKQANLDLSLAVKDNSRNVQDYYDNAGRGISQNNTFRDSIDSLSNAVDNFHKAQFQAAGMSEQFISAMKQLSPVGQDFVLQLLAIRGAWKDLQNSVQDNLFRGLGAAVTDLANKQLPLLKNGMKGVAQSINSDFKSLLKTLGSDQNSNAISKIFERTGTAISAMQPGINSLVNAFLHLSEVGSKFLPRLALAFDKVMGRFENFVNKADADGSLERWIDRGLDLVSSLGRSLLDIGSILSSVTDAYNKATGNVGGFASTMERGLSKLSDYLKSPAGKSAMISWMRDSRQFMSQIKESLPGIRELFRVMGDSLRDFATTAFPIFASIGQFLSSHARLFKLFVEAGLGLKTVLPVMQLFHKQVTNITHAFTALKDAQGAAILKQTKAWKTSFDASGMKFAAEERIGYLRQEYQIMQQEEKYAREKRDWSKQYYAQTRAQSKAALTDSKAIAAATKAEAEAAEAASVLVVPGGAGGAKAKDDDAAKARDSRNQKSAKVFAAAKAEEARALKQYQDLTASFDGINKNRAYTQLRNTERVSQAYHDLHIATNLATRAEENLAKIGAANSGASGWMNRMKMGIGARTGNGLAGSLGVLAAAFGGVVTAIGTIGITAGAIYAFDQLTAAQERNKTAADNLNESQRALADTLTKGTGSATSATLEENARQLKDRPNPVHPDDRGQNFDAAKILEAQMGIKLDEAVRLALPTEAKPREARLAPGDAKIIAAVPGLAEWRQWGKDYRKNGVDEGVYGRALDGVPEDVAKVVAAKAAIRAADGAESWMPDALLENTNRIPRNLGAAQEQLPRSGEAGGLRGLSLAIGAERGIGTASAVAGRGLQETAGLIPQKGLNGRGLRAFTPFKLGAGGAIYNPDGTATVEVDVYPDSVRKGWADGAAANGIQVERRYPGGAIIHIDKEHAKDYLNVAPGYAAGGGVWGAGSATSDSIPAMLSNGEFVINAKSASLIGHDNLNQMNQMRVPGFAPGGPVKRDLIGPGGGTDIYWPQVPMVTPAQAAGNPMSQTLPQAIGKPTTGLPGSLFGPSIGLPGAGANIPPNTLPEIFGPYLPTGPMTPTASGGRRHPVGHPKPTSTVPGLEPDVGDDQRDHGTGAQPGPGGPDSEPGKPGTTSTKPVPASSTPGAWTPEEMEIAKGLAANTENLEGYKQILLGNSPSSLSEGTKSALGSILGIPGGPVAPPLSPGPGPVQLTATAADNILKFADSVAGKTPYTWGGYSMAGMDCSGLALAMANIATGKDPFDGGRVSTFTIGARLAQMGFQRGKGGNGSLTVGWMDPDGGGPGGHAGVTLMNGVGLTAQNPDAGIVMGSEGANDSTFTDWMFLPLSSMPTNVAGLPGLPELPLTLPDPERPFGIGNYPLSSGLRPVVPGLAPPLPDVAAGPTPGLPEGMFGPLGQIDPILLLKQVGISILEGLLGIFGIDIDLNKIFNVPELFSAPNPAAQAGPDAALLGQMDDYIAHYDSIGDKATADAMRASKDDYMKPYTTANMAAASEDLAKYFDNIGQPDRAAQIRTEAEKTAAAAALPAPPKTWARGGLVPRFSGGGDFSYDQWVEDHYGPPILTAFGPGNGGTDLSHIWNVFPEENAAGGHIRGPGTGTSDSIPAMLSDGEFVMRAKAVDHWGVHRLQAMNNRFSTGGPVGYAPGGPVEPEPGLKNDPTTWAFLPQLAVMLGVAGSAMARFAANPGESVMDALGRHADGGLIRGFAPGGLADPGPPPVAPSVGPGVGNISQWLTDYAKTTTGPYVYGGYGTTDPWLDPDGNISNKVGFDCSGIIGSVWALANGLPPTAAHRFTTEDNFLGMGFKRGTKPGALNIGVMNGGGGKNSHMAGTMPDGSNIESSGPRGTVFGKGARGAIDPMFPNQYYYDIPVGPNAPTLVSIPSLSQLMPGYAPGGLVDPNHSDWNGGGGDFGSAPWIGGGGDFNSAPSAKINIPLDTWGNSTQVSIPDWLGGASRWVDKNVEAEKWVDWADSKVGGTDKKDGLLWRGLNAVVGMVNPAIGASDAIRGGGRDTAARQAVQMAGLPDLVGDSVTMSDPTAGIADRIAAGANVLSVAVPGGKGIGKAINVAEKGLARHEALKGTEFYLDGMVDNATTVKEIAQGLRNQRQVKNTIADILIAAPGTRMDRVHFGDIAKTIKDVQKSAGKSRQDVFEGMGPGKDYSHTAGLTRLESSPGIVADYPPGLRSIDALPSSHQPWYDDSEIAMYLADWTNDSKALGKTWRSDVKRGFHPQLGGMTALESIVTHEMGHAIDQSMMGSLKPGQWKGLRNAGRYPNRRLGRNDAAQAMIDRLPKSWSEQMLGNYITDSVTGYSKIVHRGSPPFPGPNGGPPPYPNPVNSAVDNLYRGELLAESFQDVLANGDMAEWGHKVTYGKWLQKINLWQADHGRGPSTLPKLQGFAPGGSVGDAGSGGSGVNILDILTGGGDPNYTSQPLLAPIALADPTIASRQLATVNAAQARVDANTAAATSTAIGNYTGSETNSDATGRGLGSAVFGARANLVEQTQRMADMNTALADVGQYQGITSIPGMMEGRHRNRFDGAGSTLPAGLGVQSYPDDPSQWARSGEAINAITSPSWYLGNIPGVDMGTEGWNRKLKTPFELATGYEAPDWAQLSSKEILDSLALPNPYPIAKTYQNWENASALDLGLATLGASAFVPFLKPLKLAIPGGELLPRYRQNALGLGAEMPEQDIFRQGSDTISRPVSGPIELFPEIADTAEAGSTALEQIMDPLGIPTMYPGSVGLEVQNAMARQRIAGLQRGRITRGGVGRETLSVDRSDLDYSLNMRVILQQLYAGWDATHGIPPELRDEWISQQFTRDSGLFSTKQMSLLRDYTGAAAVNPLLRDQATAPLSLLDVTENMLGRNAWSAIMRDVPMLDSAMDTAPRTMTDAVVTRMISPSVLGLPDNFAQMLADGTVPQDLLDSILGKDFIDPGYSSMSLGHGYNPVSPGGGIPGKEMGIVSILPGGSRGLYLSAAEEAQGLSGLGRGENEILGPRGQAFRPFRFALADPSDPSRGFYAYSEMSQPAGIAPLPRFAVPDLNDMMEMSRFETLARKLGVTPEELSAKLGIPMPGAGGFDLGSSAPESIAVSPPKLTGSDPLADLPLAPIKGKVNSVFTGDPNNYDDSWFIGKHGREAYDKFMEENPYVKPTTLGPNDLPKERLTGNPNGGSDFAYIYKYGEESYQAALARQLAEDAASPNALDQFPGAVKPALNSTMDEVIKAAGKPEKTSLSDASSDLGSGYVAPPSQMSAVAEAFPPEFVEKLDAFTSLTQASGAKLTGITDSWGQSHSRVPGYGLWAARPETAARLAAAWKHSQGNPESLAAVGTAFQKEEYQGAYDGLIADLSGAKNFDGLDASQPAGYTGFADSANDFLPSLLEYLNDPTAAGLAPFTFDPVVSYHGNKLASSRGSMIADLLRGRLLRPDLLPENLGGMYDPARGGMAQTYLGQPGAYWMDKIQEAIDGGLNGTFLGMDGYWWAHKTELMEAQATGGGKASGLSSEIDPANLPNMVGNYSVLNPAEEALLNFISQTERSAGLSPSWAEKSPLPGIAKGIKSLTIPEQQMIGALLPTISANFGLDSLKITKANKFGQPLGGSTLNEAKTQKLLEYFTITEQFPIHPYDTLGQITSVGGLHPPKNPFDADPGAVHPSTVSKNKKENWGIVDGELNLSGGAIGVSLFNHLSKKPGMLQSWLKMSPGQKQAVYDSLSEQKKWVGMHFDDKYTFHSQLPDYDVDFPAWEEISGQGPIIPSTGYQNYDVAVGNGYGAVASTQKTNPVDDPTGQFDQKVVDQIKISEDSAKDLPGLDGMISSIFGEYKGKIKTGTHGAPFQFGPTSFFSSHLADLILGSVGDTFNAGNLFPKYLLGEMTQFGGDMMLPQDVISPLLAEGKAKGLKANPDLLEKLDFTSWQDMNSTVGKLLGVPGELASKIIYLVNTGKMYGGAAGKPILGKGGPAWVNLIEKHVEKWGSFLGMGQDWWHEQFFPGAVNATGDGLNFAERNMINVSHGDPWWFGPGGGHPQGLADMDFSGLDASEHELFSLLYPKSTNGDGWAQANMGDFAAGMGDAQGLMWWHDAIKTYANDIPGLQGRHVDDILSSFIKAGPKGAKGDVLGKSREQWESEIAGFQDTGDLDHAEAYAMLETLFPNHTMQFDDTGYGLSSTGQLDSGIFSQDWPGQLDEILTLHPAAGDIGSQAALDVQHTGGSILHSIDPQDAYDQWLHMKKTGMIDPAALTMDDFANLAEAFPGITWLNGGDISGTELQIVNHLFKQANEALDTGVISSYPVAGSPHWWGNQTHAMIQSIQAGGDPMGLGYGIPGAFSGVDAAEHAKSLVTSIFGLNPISKAAMDANPDFDWGFARGGHVRGPGTGTSDSIPAMLSHGEFVMRADAVNRIGVPALQAMNSGGFARGGHDLNVADLEGQTNPYTGDFGSASQVDLAMDGFGTINWKHARGGLVRSIRGYGIGGFAGAPPLAPGPIIPPPIVPPPPAPEPVAPPPEQPHNATDPDKGVPADQLGKFDPNKPIIDRSKLPHAANDPDAFKNLDKITPASMAGSLLSPKGVGGGVSASTRAPRSKDPRAILGAAPTSDSHVNPALAGGIKGVFSTVGSIVSTAASLAAAGGSMGASAAIPGGSQAASALVSAGFQMAGDVAVGAANIVSSLLVGTVTPSETGQGYGAPLLPQQQPGGAMSNFQSIHNGNVVTNNLTEYSRLKDRKDAQKAAPFFNRVNH